MTSSTSDLVLDSPLVSSEQADVPDEFFDASDELGYGSCHDAQACLVSQVDPYFATWLDTCSDEHTPESSTTGSMELFSLFFERSRVFSRVRPAR